MDICLIETNAGTELHPKSIHGMLWLQTHFEDTHWEAIALKEVTLDYANAMMLSKDAIEAGIQINYIPALSITQKM